MFVQWSDLAVERKEALTLSTTRMTLENTMPDTQKAMYYAPICTERPEQAIHSGGSRLALARDGGSGNGECAVMGMGLSSGTKEVFWNESADGGWLHSFVNALNVPNCTL